MGMLSDIFHKIFPGHHPAAQASNQANPGNAQLSPQPQAQQPQQQPQPPIQSTTGVTTAAAQAPMDQVDVEQVLTGWIFELEPVGAERLERAKSEIVETICRGLEH